MGIDPGEIDAVFLPHFHGDHTRGLYRFLQRNPDIMVFMPASFPGDFQELARRSGARVVTVRAAMKIFQRACLTGPMGHTPEEQALVLDTAQGLVIMTGFV
jgi:7,8-dihydropterin-6-yl-methyl-4-(beta-D-ribofuranosyl)aminobenzene 5'-phosphate synthase